jgi:hypothetical protein
MLGSFGLRVSRRINPIRIFRYSPRKHAGRSTNTFENACNFGRLDHPWSSLARLSLAFLAPNLVKAAIEGRLPHGIGTTRLTDLPAEWLRQHQMLGLAAQ